MNNRKAKSNAPGTGWFEAASQCLLLTQIAATALYFNGYFTNPLVHKLLLGHNLALSAWLFYLIHCALRGTFTLTWSPFYIPAAALAAWGGARALTGPSGEALWSYYFFLGILSAFPLWVTHFGSPLFRRRFVTAVLLAGALMTAGCLRQLIFVLNAGPGPIPKVNLIDWGFEAITLSSGDYERQRLGSFLGHNNASTAYIWIALLYAGWLGHRLRGTAWWPVPAVFAAAGLLMIFMGGSRSVLLMAIPSAALFLAGLWRHRAGGAETAGLRLGLPEVSLRAMAIGGACALASLLALAFIASQFGAGESVFARLGESVDLLYTGTYPRVWWLSLLMASENPWAGVGFASWPFEYPFFQEMWFQAHPQTRIGLPDLGKYTMRAHNDYLQVWAELGLPGLAIAIWLLMVYIKCLGRVLSRRPVPLLGLAAGCAATATLVRALVGFPFHEAAASCLFIGNLALLSGIAGGRVSIWSPAPLRNAGPWIRGGLCLALIAGFFAASAPLFRFVHGDYLAQMRVNYGIWADMARAEAARALERGDRQTHETQSQNAQYWEANGPLLLRESFEYLPGRGRQLFEYGIDRLTSGIAARDRGAILEGIDFLERSLESYSYYESFAHMGLGYRALWKMTNEEAYLDKALENLRRSVSIMPVYFEGYAQTALLLAEAGREKESLDLLGETELRYPGAIGQGVLPLARRAAAGGRIEEAALLFNMAATILPSNEAIFLSERNPDGGYARQGIIDFYLDLNRLDMAERMMAGLAPFQRAEAVEAVLPRLLFEQLSRNRLAEARELTATLRESPAMQDMPMLWYYSGAVDWMAGRPFESALSLAKSCHLGVPVPEIFPLMPLNLDLALFPNGLIRDIILLGLKRHG